MLAQFVVQEQHHHCAAIDTLMTLEFFLDQIEHVAGAAGRAVPILLVVRPGVAIDEPTPK